jgi:NAD(P)H-nitrite reductase large subunit
MKIAVIGAGHAGVEAAVAAAAAGAEVDLFSNEGVLPYFRPRLIAVACGQAEPEAINIHPAEWYAAKGIRMHLETPVMVFDPETRRVVCRATDAAYAAVVLACGSLPIIPKIDGWSEGLPVMVLWTMREALLLRDRIRPGARVLVIGGGVLGVETALRAAEAGAKPVVVERLPRLLSANVGGTAASLLHEQVAAVGVEIRCNRSVLMFRREAGGAVTAVLDDGCTVEADVAVCSIGASPNRTLAQASGIETDRGVLIDANLQTQWPGVFAAGDVAQRRGSGVRCSAREAALQGKVAGANAAASATPRELQPYTPPQPVMTLKVGAVEVYAAGEAGGGEAHREERLDDGSLRRVCRLLVRRGDAVVGVQMVGTREGFDAACKHWSGQ